MLVRKNRFVAGRGRSLDKIPSLLRALLLLLHCYRSVWPSKLSNVVVPVVRISGRQRRAGAASMRACVWSAARAELAICNGGAQWTAPAEETKEASRRYSPFRARRTASSVLRPLSGQS